jgi:hypothetical protein
MVDLRAGLRAVRPALALAVGGALVAAVLVLLPPLADRADRAPLAAAWGLTCAAAAAAVVAWPAREASALRDLRRLRASLADRLAAREAAGHPRTSSDLTALLAEALRRVDDEIAPGLTAVARRQAELGAHLAAYQRGALVSPDPAHLERLRAIHARQLDTLAAAIRQVANADAASLAMLHETDDAAVVERGRSMVADLDAFGASLRDLANATPDDDWNRRLAARG